MSYSSIFISLLIFFLLIPKPTFSSTLMDPENLVPKQILTEALAFFEKHKSRFQNKKIISIINYGIPSSQKRFFIINLKSGQVWPLHVAHGFGSDPRHEGMAKRFSNKPGSNASSLGFYMTKNIYEGKHGKSLRLEGLSPTNSNAFDRSIVIHGANYVKDEDTLQGRSWGCPAVSQKLSDAVIEELKGGSLIYVTSK